MVFLRALCFDSRLSFCLYGLEMICLREPPTEGNDEKWWTGAKPVETSPTVGSRRDQCTVEGSGQEVTGRVPLLKHSREQSSGFVRKILKRSSSRWSKEPCRVSNSSAKDSSRRIPYLPSQSHKANGQQETAIECCRIPMRARGLQRERG